MKSRIRTVVSVAVLLLAIGTAGVSAATAPEKRAGGTANEKALCFETHGKLMNKPALTNPDACWRVHAYRMNR